MPLFSKTAEMQNCDLNSTDENLATINLHQKDAHELHILIHNKTYIYFSSYFITISSSSTSTVLRHSANSTVLITHCF